MIPLRVAEMLRHTSLAMIQRVYLHANTRSLYIEYGRADASARTFSAWPRFTLNLLPAGTEAMRGLWSRSDGPSRLLPTRRETVNALPGA